jgi:hypothetical protein
VFGRNKVNDPFNTMGSSRGAAAPRPGTISTRLTPEKAAREHGLTLSAASKFVNLVARAQDDPDREAEYTRQAEALLDDPGNWDRS